MAKQAQKDGLSADLTGLGGSAGDGQLGDPPGSGAGEYDEVKQARKFVDLFSGCGGLSLGLSLAGMRGLFAIERDEMAFETFSTNFIGDDSPEAYRFMWPSWLDQRAWGIDEVLGEHKEQLEQLSGEVEVLAGGPPCQGFSHGQSDLSFF